MIFAAIVFCPAPFLPPGSADPAFPRILYRGDSCRRYRLAFGGDQHLVENHVVEYLEAFAPECVDQDFTSVTPSAYLSSIAPLTEAEQVVRAAMPTAAVRKQGCV